MSSNSELFPLLSTTFSSQQTDHTACCPCYTFLHYPCFTSLYCLVFHILVLSMFHISALSAVSHFRTVWCFTFLYCPVFHISALPMFHISVLLCYFMLCAFVTYFIKLLFFFGVSHFWYYPCFTFLHCLLFHISILSGVSHFSIVLCFTFH